MEEPNQTPIADDEIDLLALAKSSLASFAGVDLGRTESAELSPVIYPKIVSSSLSNWS